MKLRIAVLVVMTLAMAGIAEAKGAARYVAAGVSKSAKVSYKYAVKPAAKVAIKAVKLAY